jgi:hypothetical protein
MYKHDTLEMFMIVWVKFALDYEYLDNPAREIMSNISKLGPAIVQKSEKTYENVILLHPLFTSIPKDTQGI